MVLPLGGDAGSARGERRLAGLCGGSFRAILRQSSPFLVRITGKRPFTASLMVMPRSGLQQSKQS